MNNLYPELTDYIYQFCGKFMTEDELMAKRTAMYQHTTQSASMLSAMRAKGWISEDPKILAMIADGSEALKNRIVTRIWNEHQHELPLNLCPKCNRIARTPEAQQCRFCLHDWH
jgi:hypothetical protein